MHKIKRAKGADLTKKGVNLNTHYFFPFDVLKGVLAFFWTTKKSSNLYS